MFAALSLVTLIAFGLIRRIVNLMDQSCYFALLEETSDLTQIYRAFVRSSYLIMNSCSIWSSLRYAFIVPQDYSSTANRMTSQCKNPSPYRSQWGGKLQWQIGTASKRSYPSPVTTTILGERPSDIWRSLFSTSRYDPSLLLQRTQVISVFAIAPTERLCILFLQLSVEADEMN